MKDFLLVEEVEEVELDAVYATFFPNARIEAELT